MANSSFSRSIRLSFLATPTMSQKRRMASGLMPRRLSPAIVGIRGSSHPETVPSLTRRISLRLESTV